MKRSRITCALTALALILALPACSGNTEQTEETAPTETSLSETALTEEKTKKAEETTAAETTVYIPQVAPEEELTDGQKAAAAAVSVDLTKEYQTIRGFGGINHPDWIPDLTKSQRRKTFGNDPGELGFTILRIYISDNPKMWRKSVATAKAAQDAGALVFASPWYPPAELCETFTRTEGSKTLENQKRLRHDKYAEYADHLNDFVSFMKENGVDIYAVSIQNEPDYAEEWTWWTSDETTEFMENYADRINCRVMSPESFQYTNKDYYTKILDSEKAFENCDLFATHLYGTMRAQMDFPRLEECGKDIWMTEVYVPNSEKDSNMRWPESLKVAENIHNAITVGNMNAYVWWYIRRNYGPMNEDGTISKRGYCMAQYSKFVRPGYVRTEADEQPADKVYISAYKYGDSAVIVAVNGGSAENTVRFDFGSVKIAGADRYRTSASENLAETIGMTTDENGFYALLPSESVSTFTVKLAG